MRYVTSTIVRQTDVALNGNLFGGKLLAWCDEYAGLYVYRYLNHKFVTYKIEDIYFLKNAKQGEIIDFLVDEVKYEKISVSLRLIARAKRDPKRTIIDTHVTFVAIDIDTEKAIKINPFLFERLEFEECINQWMKVPADYTKANINVTGKNGDLTLYKKNYVAELYYQTYNKDVPRAITAVQKDYGKLFGAEVVTDIIAKINNLAPKEEVITTEGDA